MDFRSTRPLAGHHRHAFQTTKTTAAAIAAAAAVSGAFVAPWRPPAMAVAQ